MVQWLALGAITAEGLGSVPGQGTKIPQSHGMAKKKTWTVLRRHGRSPVECPPVCVGFLPIRPGLYSFNVWVTSGVGDGQGGLACCSPWGHKESDKLSDWTELNWYIFKKNTTEMRCPSHHILSGLCRTYTTPLVRFSLSLCVSCTCQAFPLWNDYFSLSKLDFWKWVHKSKPPSSGTGQETWIFFPSLFLACRILVPQPRIEPESPAVEA